MQKRLSIARATLHQPRLLLLDEPEAGLDRESVAILKSLLEEWTEAGRSVVMTTHDVELGLSWAHRAAVLRSGGIQFPSSDEYPNDASLRRLMETSPESNR
jgi:ABC-type multidrug transport system ATPase subunit